MANAAANASATDPNYIYVKCPYCDGMVEVHQSEINCAIFRHAVDMNFEPISPHMPKPQCDELVNGKKIYGCAGPFKLGKVNGNWVATACGYI